MDLYSDRSLLLAEVMLRGQQGVAWADLVEINAGILAQPETIPHADTYWQQLAQLTPTPDWNHHEPTALADIQATLPPITHHAPRITFDQLHGGLLGRFAGMMLGKPLEGMVTAKNIRDYLQSANAYPLTDYVPLQKPLPPSVPWWGRWHDTTKGNITRVVQDDDVEYTLAGLLILQKYGLDFTTVNVGEFWLDHFAYGRVFTAERVAYRNLINGLPPATYRNPYREWIGAQIRADAYGYVCPAQPRRAAALAYKDAALSHTGNGIYGAMWVAGMIAAAYVLRDPVAIVEAGLAEIPPRSRLAVAIRDVMAWAKDGGEWEETLGKIAGIYGTTYQADHDTNWVHTIPNACLVAMGLLHGNGDFGKSIGIAVMGGWDTDCNGATVGSILGVMLGASQLPAQWIDPLNDEIESFIPGYNGMKISAMAEQIRQLMKT